MSMKKNVSFNNKKEISFIKEGCWGQATYMVTFLCKLNTAGKSSIWGWFKILCTAFLVCKEKTGLDMGHYQSCTCELVDPAVRCVVGTGPLQDISLEIGMNPGTDFQVLGHSSHLKPLAVLSALSSSSFQKKLASKILRFSQENLRATICSLAEKLEQA